METDFFAYSRRKIEKDKEEGHFEAAHNREMALRCFVNFLGKEELSLVIKRIDSRTYGKIRGMVEYQRA